MSIKYVLITIDPGYTGETISSIRSVLPPDGHVYISRIAFNGTLSKQIDEPLNDKIISELKNIDYVTDVEIL